MPLTILKPGILDTLQDAGRNGYASAGINPGGVMDRYAASVANSLVGNVQSAAVLELHFPAAQMMFQQPSLIAVCGADFSAAIHDEAIPNWQPVMVKRNAVLHFPKWKWGARAYLAVRGGFDVPQWLGSYSTNLKAGAGGYAGRILQREDVLEINNSLPAINAANTPGTYSEVLGWGVYHAPAYVNPGQLLVVPGPEWDTLHEGSKKLFTGASFVIQQQSDRMGYRLDGPSIETGEQLEMVSAGVSFGTIQLLPNGKLMVLMADHQTTGGYPRIGNIVGAHLPKLAQLLPGSEVQFQLTDINTAEQMLFSQRRDLQMIERACHERINQLYACH